jgi:hypothetical protein
MQMQDHRFDHPSAPVIRVDPQMRCAVARVFSHHLLVLPFQSARAASSVSAAAATTSAALTSSSSSLSAASAPSPADLALTAAALLLPPVLLPKKLEDDDRLNILKHDVLVLRRHAHVGTPLLLDARAVGVKHSRDFAFLDGYVNPTLLVLHELRPTWAGRYAALQMSNVLTTLALDLAAGTVAAASASAAALAATATTATGASTAGGYGAAGHSSFSSSSSSSSFGGSSHAMTAAGNGGLNALAILPAAAAQAALTTSIAR